MQKYINETEGETELQRARKKVTPRVKPTALGAMRGMEMKRNAKKTEALDLPNGRNLATGGLRDSYHRFTISVSLMKASRYMRGIYALSAGYRQR